MSKLNNKQVQKVAQLAKIKISSKETGKYAKELSGILDYVEILDKVDTKKIEETSQVTGLENVYRGDEKTDEWKVDKNIKKNTDKLLANTKNKKDDYIKVKQMLN